MTWKEYMRTVIPDAFERHLLREWLRVVFSGGRPDRALYLFGYGRSGCSMITAAIENALHEGQRAAYIGEAYLQAAEDVRHKLTDERLVVATLSRVSASVPARIKELIGDAPIPGGLIIQSNIDPLRFESPAFLHRLLVLQPRQSAKCITLDGPNFIAKSAHAIRQWAGV